MATHATVTEERSARTSSADWSTSYANFLSRASAQAAATLGLYQQALIRVSEGKLEPTIFQSHFPNFIQAHGSEYANRLSELGSRFLSRLVELSAASSRRGVEPAAPQVAEPDLIPPRFEPDNPVRWYEQFAEYAGKLNNRALKAYRAQLDHVAAGEKTPGEVQQDTVDYLSNNFPQALQQMTQLYFDLLNGLNDVRARYERDYFESVLALARQPERSAPIVLELTAPRGEVSFATLALENTTAARTAIQFRFTDCRRVDGAGPAFTPNLEITPPVLELEPGEERKIRLALRLALDRYQEAVLYNCTLFISGGDALRVEVDLRIVATEVTHAISGASAEG